MTVPGDQWPIFLYAGYEYDAEDPWKGLFKSNILVCVSFVVTVASCEQLINCFVRLINDEQQEVRELLVWWNRQVLPLQTCGRT